MYARMIARDFRRNRAVTVVLIVLMMLSVVLAAASAGTLVRLMGAASSLMDRADAPHVAQLHAGTHDQQDLERWVAGRSEVAHHQVMLLLNIDGANLFFDGQAQTTSIQQNALVVPNRDRDLLLGLDDQPITDVEPGTIVLPVYYEVEDGLAVGDVVTITAADGFRLDLEIAAFARDSIMNPAIASSKRLAVAPSDQDAVAAHTGDVEQLITFWLHDPAVQSAAFQKAYQDSGMPQAGQMVDAATFRMLTVIGDGIVAAIVILVSVLLLVVGLLCLRFSFLTAAEQDYREIGVLKAIGVAPRGVKAIYLTKYALLAGVAAVLGLLGGLSLIPLLTRNITRYMGSVTTVWSWVIPVLAAVGVFASLVLFVLVLLRRFDRISAVTALSAGATGQQSRGVHLRLHRSRMPVHLRLGIMDVIGRWPTYLLLLLVFAVSTFIMVVPTSSATTVTDPGFINQVGVGTVDLRIELRNTGAASDAQFTQAVDRLRADADVTAVSPMVTTRNDTVDADGIAVSLYVENGDHTLLPVTYAEGRAADSSSEIALSLQALVQSGRQVGEVLPVEVGGQVRDLTIVGSYQDITNGGTTAKSVQPTDGNDIMWYMIGVELAPGVDAAGTAARYSDLISAGTVNDIAQWQAQTLGPIARQVMVTAAVSVVVALALAMLMTGLFTRMLVARDAGQIAIQRAVGADDVGIRRQYLTRIALVLVVGVVLGTVAAGTVGQTLFNAMFGGMYGGFESLFTGTSRIDFAVHPLLGYLALPGALLAAVMVATAASSRPISDASIAALTTE